jgi:hypothetical protein
LKERVTASETAIESAKGVIGSANPKMMAEQANLASMRRQIGEATEKMKQHLKQHIATAQDQITALEAEQTQAQKALIQLQGQRARLSELQHDVAFPRRAAQCAGEGLGGGEAEIQVDVFGYDGPRQGDGAPRAFVSEALTRDSGRDRRRHWARFAARAACRGDRSQGPLPDRS